MVARGYEKEKGRLFENWDKRKVMWVELKVQTKALKFVSFLSSAVKVFRA